MAPRWPHDGPKMAQHGPKIAQDSPQRAREGPKKPNNGPKMAPRWPRIAPRGPKMATEAQDGPKMARDGAKMAPDSPKIAFKIIKNLKENQYFGFWIAFWPVDSSTRKRINGGNTSRRIFFSSAGGAGRDHRVGTYASWRNLESVRKSGKCKKPKALVLRVCSHHPTHCPMPFCSLQRQVETPAP